METPKKIDKCIVHIEDIIEVIVAGHCTRNTNLYYLEKTLELLNEIKKDLENPTET